MPHGALLRRRRNTPIFIYIGTHPNSHLAGSSHRAAAFRLDARLIPLRHKLAALYGYARVNANIDTLSTQLLNEACDDIRALRSSSQQAFRQKRQNFASPPDRLEEAHQAGVQAGFALALEVLTNRLILETGKHVPTPDAGTARAYTELKVAEAEYNLRSHGATAPLASAAYSAYAQAHRRLEQARSAYTRHTTSHTQVANDDRSTASA